MHLFTRKGPGSRLRLVEGETRYLETGRARVADRVAPAAVDPHPGYLDLGGRFARTLKVVGFSREVENGWLDELYTYPANLRVAQYLVPIPSGPAVRELGAEITKLEVQIRDAVRRGKAVDPYVQVSYEDAVSLRDALARNQIKLFHYHLLITVFADSLEELDDLTADLQQRLEGIMVQTRSCYFQQEESFKSTMPFGKLLVPAARNMDSLSLSTTFPFGSSDLVHNGGEFWGINLVNRSVVVLDRGLLPAGHMILIGATGSGKSFALKNVDTQSFWFGRALMAIDPSKDEYQRWADQLGIPYVRLSLTSAQKINVVGLAPPRDLSKLEQDELMPVTAKAQYMAGFLEVLVKNPGEALTPKERAVIVRHVRKVFTEKGIEDRWESVYEDAATGALSLRGRLKEQPVLSDLHASFLEDPEARELAVCLEPYLGSFFDGQTTVDVQARGMVFNIYQVLTSTPHLAPAVYYILSDLMIAWLRADPWPKEICIDEAHHMFRHLAMALHTERLFREARKVGGRVALLTQCLSDFLGEEDGDENNPLRKAARACLANAFTKFIMMQTNLAEVRYAGKVFGLSQAEMDLITPPSDLHEDAARSKRGTGILIAGMQRVPVKVAVSPTMYRILTTDPEEVALIEADERGEALG